MQTDYQANSENSADAQKDSILQVLSVENSWILLALAGEYLCISSKSLYHFKLKSQLLQANVVSQPLLMPVSMPCDKKLGLLCEPMVSSLNSCGFELVCAHNKIILKQVPAGLRQLNWSNILSLFLERAESDAENSNTAMISSIVDEQASHAQKIPGSLMQLWSWFVAIENWQEKITDLADPIPLPEWLEKFNA